MRGLLRNLLAMAMLLGLIAGIAPAQDKPKSPAKAEAAKAKPNKPANVKIGAEREEELLTFVRKHHHELADLLDQLKPMKAAEYEAALKDLDRDVRRLQQVKTKSPDRYDPELGLWASRSRVRLLAARLSMSEEDEELRQRIKDELRGLRQHELEVLQAEIDATKENLDKQQRRLERLQEQSADLQNNEDAWLQKRLKALENEHRKTDPPKGKKPKPKPKTDSTLKAKTKPEPATAR